MQFARTALFYVALLGAGLSAEGQTATDVILPTPHFRPAATAAGVLRPVPLVDGCGSTPITCNTDVRGQLNGNDCLSANLTVFDEYLFDGPNNEFVTATVRPLLSTYTNAWISLVPPSADTSIAPLISGGAAATVHYILPTLGSWRVHLGTNDRFASGDYLLELSCEEAPSSPQPACVTQELLCGQSATWQLSPQSCISSADPNRFYADYRVYGVAGDTLNMQLTSSAFNPQFGIYELTQSAAALAVSSASNATTDTLMYTVQHNGFYDIIVTSGNLHGTGQYVLALDCVSSGCLTPIITRQPQDVTVPLLGTAQLSADVTALGSADFLWFDATGSQKNVGAGPKFGTPPVTGPQSYYVTATTPCGTVTSRVVHVTLAAIPPPPPPPRHRATKH
jgi:hypothetical protein